jgi:hypothetical protein
MRLFLCRKNNPSENKIKRILFHSLNECRNHGRNNEKNLFEIITRNDEKSEEKLFLLMTFSNLVR